VPKTRRLAAIMFTDMAGYTAAAQADEKATLALRKEHEAIIRPLLSEHHGRKVKSTGDGLLVEFESALKATECAIGIQRRFHERNERSGITPIILRIGIHLGDVEQEGSDIFGDAVNIASRIEPVAEPGGVCLSGAVYEQVRNKVPDKLEKLPPKELKGLQLPMDLYRVVLPWTAREPRAARPEPTRLAVLPFINISPDPNDEFFSDGLTEEMIARLSRLPGLEVIARTSVMNFKHKDKSATQIGKELGAGTLLEGSVRKAGNRIRVTVQLINSDTEGHLWSENYDRNLEDIFAVQSEIAENVAHSLRIRLLEEDRKNMERGAPRKVEAYTLYLKGKFHLHRWNSSSLSQAIRYFEEAVGQDPKYAAAYAGLAQAHALLGYYRFVKPIESYAAAERYAREALALDESLPEAHLALARAMRNRNDNAAQDRELNRALELDPNLVEAYAARAWQFGRTGRWDEAIQAVERALELDPLDAWARGEAGTIYLYARQYDAAIRLLEDSVEWDPKNSFYLDNLGLAHVQKGMFEQGLDELKRAAEASGKGAANQDLAYGYCKAGKPEEARRLLAEALQSDDGGRTDPLAVAGIYASLDEKDEAIEWLEKAFKERSGYMSVISNDFVFDSLRDDPRFQSLLKKVSGS
jgi:adenylate cyclase